ncbi:arginine ABC transporter ATP-binding protein ArtP [Arsenophonus symbiont of Ornithomya chloropus]|uniref:arginine ABC transporter ATP-binding protein ArtP n=1 Tax=Arsenophonus symbiont of Ornithomya chloropus TaxID=634121 RepID=UPI0032B23A3E
MIIELTKINFFYGNYQVLHNINLKCITGETIILLGSSGAGKSSLLRVFNLLDLPSSGQLKIVGFHFDFKKKYKKIKIQNLRKQVGMVFQQYNLWPHFTVMENLIQAPCSVLGISKKIAKNKAKILLRRLQLMECSNRFPSYLSGGQQQKVAIARALMMEPKILLLDEPTASLDPGMKAQFIKITQELSKQGITQIIVTHDTNFAKKIASKIVYIEKGHILEQGDVHHLTTPKTASFLNYLSHI